jgi:hypothetical protein
MKVTLTSWWVFSKLYKVLPCNVCEQDFFNSIRDQSIQMKKCNDALHVGEGSKFKPF